MHVSSTAAHSTAETGLQADAAVSIRGNSRENMNVKINTTPVLIKFFTQQFIFIFFPLRKFTKNPRKIQVYKIRVSASSFYNSCRIAYEMLNRLTKSS
jgi:hypothetical protein